MISKEKFLKEIKKGLVFVQKGLVQKMLVFARLLSLEGRGTYGVSPIMPS